MKYIDNLDEKIFDLLINLKLDGIVRILVYTWEVTWVRDIMARLIKIYRVRHEFNMLERSEKISSQSQSLKSLDNDTIDRMVVLMSKHNENLKFWFMDKI